MVSPLRFALLLMSPFWLIALAIATLPLFGVLGEMDLWVTGMLIGAMIVLTLAAWGVVAFLLFPLFSSAAKRAASANSYTPHDV